MQNGTFLIKKLNRKYWFVNYIISSLFPITMPSFGHHYDPMPNEKGLSRSSSAHFINKNPFGNSHQRPDFNHQSSYPSSKIWSI
jgi:hypothetical protein